VALASLNYLDIFFIPEMPSASSLDCKIFTSIKEGLVRSETMGWRVLGAARALSASAISQVINHNLACATTLAAAEICNAPIDPILIDVGLDFTHNLPTTKSSPSRNRKLLIASTVTTLGRETITKVSAMNGLLDTAATATYPHHGMGTIYCDHRLAFAKDFPVAKSFPF
jgi:hypothetical protein